MKTFPLLIVLFALAFNCQAEGLSVSKTNGTAINLTINGGTFNGDGGGLTNLQATNLVGAVASASLAVFAGYAYNVAYSNVVNYAGSAGSVTGAVANVSSVVTNGATAAQVATWNAAANAFYPSNAPVGSVSNISPNNIVSNGTYLANGILATNSGATSGAFLTETGTNRAYSYNGGSLTNVNAKNATNLFATGTLIDQLGNLTNISVSTLILSNLQSFYTPGTAYFFCNGKRLMGFDSGGKPYLGQPANASTVGVGLGAASPWASLEPYAGGVVLRRGDGLSGGISDRTNLWVQSLYLDQIAYVTNGFASYRSNLLAPSSISFPATTVPWTNTFGVNIFVLLDNTAITGTAIKINGTQVSSSLTGGVNTIPLQPGEYFSETYTVGSPTATWKPQ